MRLHRFYIKEKIGDNIVLTIDIPDFVHQIRHVFRLKKGDGLVMFDGTGSDYVFTIDESTERNKIKSDSFITLKLATRMRSAFIPSRNIYLCASIIKKDKFEWVVEKATELGVTNIIPVLAERSEKKALNEERLNKIAIEASEQSGRGDLPKVSALMKLKETIEYLKKEEVASDKKIECVALHTNEEKSLNNYLSEIDKDTAIAVFIGPEGGWSEAEVEMFHSYNIPILSLGKQILRAETASLATLSLVVLGK